MKFTVKINPSNLPLAPGIYIMKDASGKPIYIGKAKSIRSRVSSYFQESAAHSWKTSAMVRHVADIEFIITKNEMEALILESNFIKKHQPKYNVLLKDDKHYPYFRVTTFESFPRLEIVRKVKKDGGTYFGPYAMASEAKKILRLIHKIFPIRQCRDFLDGSKKRRPCLNYQMGRCLGPCSGEVSREEYGKSIREVILFLKGRNNELADLLKDEMNQASQKLDFEKAALRRDQIAAIHNIMEKQVTEFSSQEDLDVLGSFTKDRTTRMQVLSVRAGKMMAQRGYSLHHAEPADPGEILASFLKQYYGATIFIPQEIIAGEEVQDKDLIEEWLSERKGKRVTVSVPMRGRKRSLVGMAEENARMGYVKAMQDQESKENILAETQRLLSLKKIPRRIDAFDISTTFGASSVGGMVSFVDGKPDKSKYRRFSIKEVAGIDDYAMIDETLARRYQNAQKEGGPLPDLVLIDGGKGHLNRAIQAMKRLGLEEVELVSIAKGKARNNEETDEIFRPGDPNPIASTPRHPGRRFLQTVRDEVHRFSITAHRKLRQKKSKYSVLDGVPGIGPKRRVALMKRFKGLEAMEKADIGELQSVPGITEALAQRIKEALKG